MVATDTDSSITTSVRVSPRQAAAQIQALGIPRNTLSAFLDLEADGSPPPAWQSFGPQEQAALQVALPLLAAPALAVRARLVHDDDRFLSTWVLAPAGSDPSLSPYLLLGHDEAQDSLLLQPVINREAVARSFLPYLDAGLPAGPGQAFTLPLAAFSVLLALCDLYRRARYSSGLGHIPQPQKFTLQDLEQALVDGRDHADPRWLLPHLQMLLPEFPAASGLAPSLQTLVSLGWLVNEAGCLSLSETGASLAHALDQRLALLAFWAVGATPQGDLGFRSLLFVRSPWQIWCFDLGGEDGKTVEAAAADVASAYGLLQDLLTPLGMPRLLQQPMLQPLPQTPPVQAPVSARPARSAPPSGRGASSEKARKKPSPAAPRPPAKSTCSNCGKPVNKGARFCPNCGQPLSQKG